MAAAIARLLASPAFRVFITGAGFFSDSYDLFITDGVTNILKDLGPVSSVAYTYVPSAGSNATTLTSYFSAYCTQGLACLPKLYNATSGAWEANPTSVWTPEFSPHYQLQTPGLKNGVSNAALIGSITGQVAFGFAGDVLGRKWCFVVTTLLIIVGCLGSATAAAGARVPGALNAAGAWASSAAQPSGFGNDVYGQLILWRAVLGFGVGGEYPLAGTIASEGAETAGRGRAVLYTFSMQGWGKLTASLVNYFLVCNLTYFGGAWRMDSAWRLALALGCTLNVLTLPFRWAMEESHIFTKTASAVALGAGGGAGALEGEGAEGAAAPAGKAAALALPTPPKPEELAKASKATLALLYDYRWTLLGTASTWFLIDVTFYGQSLMNTTVVSEAVASTIGLNTMEKLRSSLLSTVWIMLIAIPGYFVAIACVDWLGRKPLQRLGFLATAATFLVLGAAYNTRLRLASGGVGFVLLYGLTYLFSNAGPNSVTFLMPAEAFPTQVRATAHGISAAFGKVGATVGGFGLLELYYAKGVEAVMFVCFAVALLGAGMNEAFCKETGGVSLEDVDRGGKGSSAAGEGMCERAVAAISGSSSGSGSGSGGVLGGSRGAWEGGEDSDTAPLAGQRDSSSGQGSGKQQRVTYGSIPWPEP